MKENETTMGACEDSMLLLKSGPKYHLMLHVTVEVELFSGFLQAILSKIRTVADSKFR